MKRYNKIEVGMLFISGMNPNKDHRHIMQVIQKNKSKDTFIVKSIKCLGPGECETFNAVGRTHKVTSELLENAHKKVFFQWLDTEVAQILYERD